MEEIVSQTQDQWNYGLLKNGAGVAPEGVLSSLEIGDEELLIRVQGLSVRLFVHGEPIKLAPYLVYRSPDISGTIPVREYEGEVAGSRFGIYCVDADTDIDLIQPDGTAWWGMSRYKEEGMN
ncbi:MAG: hypothetical protein ACJ8CB_07920 [Ktedonobacteraceae bacterium]